MKTIDRIRAELAPSGCDAFLVSSPANKFYASGFMSDAGLSIIGADFAYLSTDFRYFEDAQKASETYELIMCTYELTYFDILKLLCDKHNVKRLGYEEEFITASYYNKLSALGVTLVPCSGVFTKLRLVKTPDEVEKIKKAQSITEKSFDALLPKLSVGMTEADVRAELEYLLTKLGSQRCAFDTIAVSGENGSRCHGVPGMRKIKNGDFLTLDFGAVYGEYASDMTRTVAFGFAKDEMRRVYSCVLTAQKEALSAAKAGIRGCDLHKVAFDVINDAGYGAYFGHGLGHSVGIEVHDGPGASPSNKNELPEGIVLSIEPGIYIPGKFGVRIEDLVYLTSNGCENLTHTPKELVLI